MIEFNSLSADFIPSEDAIIRMSWKDTLQWFRRIQTFVDEIPVESDSSGGGPDDWSVEEDDPEKVVPARTPMEEMCLRSGDEEEEEEDPDAYLDEVQPPPRDRWWRERAEKEEKQRQQESRSLHGRKAAAARWNRRDELAAELAQEEKNRKRAERAPHRETDKAVLATLVFGTHLAQMHRVCKWMRWPLPSIRTIQRRIAVVGAELVEFAKRKIEVVYQQMPRGSSAALDGAWAHPRHSEQHALSVVSPYAGASRSWWR